MDSHMSGWMAAAGARVELCHARREPAALPAPQRHELQRMSLAAVASSALVIAASAAWSPLQGRPLTSVALAVHSPALATAAPLPSSVVAMATRPSDVRQRSSFSPRPLLVARQLPATRYVQPAAPVLLRASARTPSRITRLLFGDGRYRIQPFPTRRFSTPDEQSTR